MKGLRGIINMENISAARNVLMKTVKSQPLDVSGTKALVVGKLQDMNAFYKHVTGLDELEYYQDRVIELQDSLMEAQLKRREMSYILHDVRNKGIEVQDRIHKVKRHEDPAMFLELMREENEFIRKEREVFSLLSDQERHEREVFTAFTNAIRDSQDKQRTRLEYTKYIGFGLTLMGALASYAITTWRTEDLKKVIRIAITEDVVTVIGQIGGANQAPVAAGLLNNSLAKRLKSLEADHNAYRTSMNNSVKEIVHYLNQGAKPIPNQVEREIIAILFVGTCFIALMAMCCGCK